MPRKPAGAQPARIERVILPEVESLVAVRTAPNAVCFLGHEAAKGQRMQLDADAEGVVRFHARPPKDGRAIALDLECTGEDGATTRHRIHVRGDARAPAQGAAEEQAGPGAHGSVRPALAGDLLALSNQELVARGYPPRPDPVSSPARYARWHRNVSRPFTIARPAKVAHPGVSFARPQPRSAAAAQAHLRPDLPPKMFSPTLPLPPPMVRPMFNANWNSWSGAYLNNPHGQFFWIEADWSVPGVFSLPGSPIYSAAAEWVGLDNSGTDLYQAGTDSECWFFLGWTFTNYWMWIETLPFDPWGLPNFPLSPGDAVSVDIFVADPNGMTWFQDGSNGGLTPADNSVWFMIYNDTKGLSFWGTLPTAPQSGGGRQSTGFTGATAEFIVERPFDTGSNSSYPLAPFGIAGMNSCWYGDALYGDRPWQLGADGSTPFDGSLTYINMQNRANGDLLDIALSLPDATSPGGYEILWIWVNDS